MLFYFVAAIILPGALGCCLPQKYEGFTFFAGLGLAKRFTIDFTQKKFWTQPMHSKVEFVLTDFAAGKKYTKQKDGSCTVVDSTQHMFPRCLPSGSNVKTYTSTFGPSTGGLSLNSVVFMENGNRGVWLTSNDGKCHPVMRIGKVTRPTIDTLVFGNITENIDMTVLNQDVSACVPKA